MSSVDKKISQVRYSMLAYVTVLLFGNITLWYKLHMSVPSINHNGCIV